MTRPRTRSFSLSGANKKSTKPSVRYIHDIQSLKPCSALQCSRAHHPPYATHTHTHTQTVSAMNHFPLTSCSSFACTEVVIGVPAPYLSFVRELLNPDFAVAAQNCLDKSSGAYTGEICPVRSLSPSHCLAICLALCIRPL